ncbi:MAG: hypothetical protein H6Q77_2165 [Gemmatimonadetes bacterium]|nr:hypothetical protein [Gemmatimonadota bacterium]
MSDASWHQGLPWVTLLLLGALHGLNPGMGWLFAVALGFQERQGRAVWRALPPLAAGHALAVGAALLMLLAIGGALPEDAVRLALGATLVGLGLYRLRWHRHPRGAGMRANARQLTSWSFLMASAHGAGLMVLPLMAGVLAGSEAHHGVMHASMLPGQAAWLAAGVHTAGYLFITGLVAWLVYEKLGLRRLTSVWFNVDLVWAVALVGTGAVVLAQVALG